MKAFLLSVVLVLLCGATGCGYKAGFLIPADIHSVAIRVTDNRTFWKEASKTDNIPSAMPQTSPRPANVMEVDLTEKLKNEVARRTPLKIVDESRADSVLETTIREVLPQVQIRDVNDNMTSARVTLVVDFAWRDRRTGRMLSEGKGVTRPTDFLVPKGETFTTAARREFDRIAELIVEQMQEGF